MQEVTLKGPIEYIKEAVKIYFKKENLMFFVKVMSLSVIFSTIISYLIGYLYPNGVYEGNNTQSLLIYAVLTILSIFLNLWMQTSSYFSIIDMNKNEMDVIRKTIKKTPLFFGVSFVLGIIFLVGTLLLIIPGIIFGIWYSFTLFLVFDKEMKLNVALKTSKNLVKGKMLKVVGRGIVFGLFAILGSIFVLLIPFAGSIAVSLIAPLFVLPSYLLYKDLINQKDVSVNL